MKLTQRDRSELDSKRAEHQRNQAANPPAPASLAEAKDDQLAGMTFSAIAALPDVDIHESTIMQRVKRDGMTPRAAATIALRAGGHQKPTHRSQALWNSTPL